MRRAGSVCLIVVAAVIAATSSPALAQQSPGPVAVVNTARVFNEMQEFKDLSQKLETERKDLQTQAKQREAELQTFEAERDQYRADSAQYQEAHQKYMAKAIEFRAWGEMTQADQQRRYKLDMRRMFEKLKAGVGEVARQRGITVVVAERRPDIELEKLSMEQLKNAIVQTDVLYVAPDADLTSIVIAHLDAQYKQGQ